MWWKWFPWKYFVRDAARRQGFLDPVKVLSQLQRFAQPSEVMAPTELLRSGVVLHARGLMNSLAIQHNLDWVWPFWVECQYDPRNEAFIPRSFSLTQINLTHRNWTALGVPDGTEFPLVDPRGLVTPFYDSWSIDVWVIPEAGEPLIPSRAPNVSQRLVMDDNLCVITESSRDQIRLQLQAQVIGPAQAPLCRVRIRGASAVTAQLVVSLRPYNPEGVSFIHDIAMLEDGAGWRVNHKDMVCLSPSPERSVFSYYLHGDVYGRLMLPGTEQEIYCKVGMATAAALYPLEAGQARDITLTVPLIKNKMDPDPLPEQEKTAQRLWRQARQGVGVLQVPDKHFQFLYDAAIHTLILHSPGEVYPGPFIYRRFWFRDAAFILYALLCVGLKSRVRRALDCFRFRQTAQGYFFSQEGEWDSNGEALWIMRQYCEMTGVAPPGEWQESIRKAGQWIYKKRLPSDRKFDHAGLMPAGFSAEHLGPNDFYYWDDFWAVAGLRAAVYLSRDEQDRSAGGRLDAEAAELSACIDRSLVKTAGRLKRPAIPASPYRRLDAGAIGSLVAGYPLQLFDANDPRTLDTAEFLLHNCLFQGGFFHDMTHSGINPYLTLHIAQVLLRAGDPRYLDLMTEVARLASPTGQWPEAIHPRTGGGCMGDGQHVWAAAEWVLMLRNCFVREEGDRLILGSGIPRHWLREDATVAFGPAPTRFGDLRVSIRPQGQVFLVEWSGQWLGEEPPIDIQFPGFIRQRVDPGATVLVLRELG